MQAIQFTLNSNRMKSQLSRYARAEIHAYSGSEMCEPVVSMPQYSKIQRKRGRS